MAVFQDVPSTCLAELVFDQFDQTMENTLYFTSIDDGVITGVGLALIAETVAGWWATEIRPHTASAVTLREVRCTSLHEEFGDQRVFTDGRNGLIGQPALPSNVTMCVSFRTAKRGRNFRGRNYFVGLTENLVTGNTILSTEMANVATGYAQVNSYVQDFVPGVQWTVVSRETDGITRPFGITTPVTSVVVVDAFTDSMRGRLTGRGA